MHGKKKKKKGKKKFVFHEILKQVVYKLLSLLVQQTIIEKI